MENKLWWPEKARQPQKGIRASGHIANVKACIVSVIDILRTKRGFIIIIIIFSDVKTLLFFSNRMACYIICGNSVLISNCQLWFTPLPLCTNDCNEQTLPAASSWLISLILCTGGGFPYCWRMLIHSLGKCKLISWHNKTNDTQPTICHGLER